MLLPKKMKVLLENEENINLFFKLGIRFENNETRTITTPFDAITFATTGGNSKHFCFLTDFDIEKDLEECPIIGVFPFGGVQHSVIANNFNEFIDLVYSVGDGDLIDWLLEEDVDENEIMESINLELEEKSEDKEYNEARKAFEKLLSPKLIIPIEVVKKAKKNRKKVINVETLDGLGIKFGSKNKKVDSIKQYKEISILEFMSLWEEYDKEERIKFIRDYFFETSYEYNEQRYWENLREKIALEGFTELLKMADY